MKTHIQVIDDKKLVVSNCVDIVSLQASYQNLIDWLAIKQTELENAKFNVVILKNEGLTEKQKEAERLVKSLKKSVTYLKRRARNTINKIEKLNNVNNTLLKMIK